MHVCVKCGKSSVLISKAGLCAACWIADAPTWGKTVESRQEIVEAIRRKRANRMRGDRDQVYRDLGMVKVRGAMGGTYYE